MTRKLSALFFVFLFAFSLFSCSEKEEEKGGAQKDEVTPIFTLSAARGKEQDTAIFALSDGFVYFAETDDGFHGGFADPSHSVLCDNILSEAGRVPFDSIRVYETEKKRAVITTEKALYLALLDENSSERFSIPEGTALENALFYDSCAFIHADAARGLILLTPMDFSESYVLCPISALPDFSRLLALDRDEKKIFYALENEEGFYGISSFDYGASAPNEQVSLPFDSVISIGGGKLLFEKKDAEGGAVYTIFDTASSKMTSFTATTAFSAFTASPDGEKFIGLLKDEAGEALHIIKPSSGTRMKKVSLGTRTAGALAVSGDGETLYFSLSDPAAPVGDEVIAMLSLLS